MARPKKNLVRSINFGSITHPARNIIEQYEKVHGGRKLSELIRKLVIVYLSSDPNYKDYAQQYLVHQYEEYGKKISELGKQRAVLRQKLEEQGIEIAW